MKKNVENKEVSDFRNKNSVILIVSIISIILFIGTALQPAVANQLSELETESDEKENVCTLCRSRTKNISLLQKFIERFPIIYPVIKLILKL
jgi:hypothetical protein